jgi:hypothetical protein
MRKTLSLVAAACMAVPAAAVAKDSGGDTSNSAAKACKEQRSSMGSGAFKAAYGTNKNRSNAFGKCVSKMTRMQEADGEKAAKECKAERRSNSVAFAAKYGTNKNGKNAYGKCVSQKSDEADDERTDATVSASKQCKAERKAGESAFAQKYGTNKGNKNAFGKCVSRTAKTLQDQS